MMLLTTKDSFSNWVKGKYIWQQISHCSEDGQNKRNEEISCKELQTTNNKQGLVIGEFRGAFVTIPIVRGSKFNYQEYENLTERDLKLNPPQWGPHRPCFYFRRHHHRRRRESDQVSAPAPWRRRRRTPASETVRKRLSQARRWWSRPPSSGSPPQFPFQHWKCCSSGSRMNLRSGTPRRDLCTPPPSCSTVRLSTIFERWRAASSLPFPRR